VEDEISNFIPEHIQTSHDMSQQELPAAMWIYPLSLQLDIIYIYIYMWIRYKVIQKYFASHDIKNII